MRGSWWCGVPVIVVMTAGCLISPVMHFGGNGKSARENQRATMQSNFGPAELRIEHSWSGPVSTVRVRVYADNDYASQNMHWQDRFGETLEKANSILEAGYGIRLVPEYRTWNRNAPDAPLSDALAALVALDPGTNVFTVIGLTSKLHLAEPTFEQLGLAEVGGNHMVMRGYADAEERKAFEDAFPEIPADERAEEHEARRRHKLVVVLLHELGHTYGAGHDETETIMNSHYSKDVAGFSSASHAAIAGTLDQRLGRVSKQQPTTPTVATSSPSPSTPAAPAKPITHIALKLYLTPSGKVIVDKRTLDPTELDKLLRESVASDPNAEVAILKDASNENYGMQANLTQRVRAAGIEKVTITNK